MQIILTLLESTGPLSYQKWVDITVKSPEVNQVILQNMVMLKAGMTMTE